MGKDLGSLAKDLAGHDDLLGRAKNDLFGRESSLVKDGLCLFGLTPVEGRQKKVQCEADPVRGEVKT